MDVDKSCDVSPLTDYVRQISLQPAHLWLARPQTSVIDSDTAVNVASSLPVEAAAGFVHYVKAASGKPLDYWQSDPSSCEVTSLPPHNADVFWLWNTRYAGVCEWNPSLLETSSVPRPHEANVRNYWLPESSRAEEHLDQTETLVIVVANGTSLAFSFNSAVDGCAAVKSAANFYNDVHDNSIISKSDDYWLRAGSGKLCAVDTEMQSLDSKISLWPVEDKWLNETCAELQK